MISVRSSISLLLVWAALSKGSSLTAEEECVAGSGECAVHGLAESTSSLMQRGSIRTAEASALDEEAQEGQQPDCVVGEVENTMLKPCEEGKIIKYKEFCTPKCKLGYRPNKEKAECRWKGLMEGFTCAPHRCIAPMNIPNADPLKSCEEGKAFMHREICTPKCNNGYTPSETELKCVDGEFNIPTFDCIENTCRAPASSAVTNNNDGPTCLEGNIIQPGEVCTPNCKPGYLPNVESLSCSAGSLSPARYQCIPQGCIAPNDKMCQEGQYIDHGGRCSAVCPAGFQPAVPSLSCEAGVLDPPTVVCERVWDFLGRGLCGGIEPLMEGGEKKRADTLMDCQSACEGEGECNAICHQPGERVPCLLFTRCDGVAEVSAMGVDQSGFNCYRHPEAKVCTPPHFLHGANSSGACCQGDEVRAGHRMTVMCEKGYEAPVSDSRCLRGALVPAEMSCEPRTCRQPTRILHRHPEGPCAEGAVIPSGGQCTPQCAHNYEPTVPALACHLGELYPLKFECVEKAIKERSLLPGSYEKPVIPNLMPGLVPTQGAWRGTTVISRFHKNKGFDAHMLRHFWKGAPLPQEVIDHVHSGGILWMSIQPHDWAEASSSAFVPTIKKMAGIISTLAPAQVMVSVGHEPDIHCTECQTDENYGTIQQYKDMWVLFQKTYAEVGCTNVVWVMDYAGKKNPKAFENQVIPLWPGNERVQWLFWNLFQLGGPMDTKSGNFSEQLRRSYANFMDYSSSDYDFLSKPWGLGAWSATDLETTCDRISYLRTAMNLISSEKYNRFQAAVYFDSKTGLVDEILRPTYQKYLSLDMFTVNDANLPHLKSCAAPIVAALGPNYNPQACEEGFEIESGHRCTTQCAEGYIPSTKVMDCFDGVFRPGSFECLKAWPEMGQGMCQGVMLSSDEDGNGRGSCQHQCEEQSQTGGRPCSAYCHVNGEADEEITTCAIFQSCDSVQTTVSGISYKDHKCYSNPHAIDCKVPSVNNEDEKGLCEEGSTIAFGERCTLSCRMGYKPNTRRMLCGLDGIFAETPRCTKKSSSLMSEETAEVV